MRRPPGIQVKSVAEPPAADDGFRYLVDREWPPGLQQEAVTLDGWLRDLAPSDRLWRWFGRRAERWPEFLRRYFAELDAKKRAWQFLARAARRERITLLYAERDPWHNSAVALQQYLLSRVTEGGPAARDRSSHSSGGEWNGR